MEATLRWVSPPIGVMFAVLILVVALPELPVGNNSLQQVLEMPLDGSTRCGVSSKHGEATSTILLSATVLDAPSDSAPHSPLVKP